MHHGSPFYLSTFHRLIYKLLIKHANEQCFIQLIYVGVSVFKVFFLFVVCVLLLTFSVYVYVQRLDKINI